MEKNSFIDFILEKPILTILIAWYLGWQGKELLEALNDDIFKRYFGGYNDWREELRKDLSWLLQAVVNIIFGFFFIIVAYFIFKIFMYMFSMNQFY